MTLRVRANEPIVSPADHHRIAIVLDGTPGTVESASYAWPPPEAMQGGLPHLTLRVRWDVVVVVDGLHSEVAHEFSLSGITAMQVEYLDDAR